jgi:hypothetical protein
MRPLIALLLFLSTTTAVADVVRVRIVPGNAAAASCRGSVDDRAWRAGETLLFDQALPLGVTLHSAECWIAPLQIERAGETAVHVWRKRTLRGRVVVSRGDVQPAAMTARIASPPKTVPAVAPSDVECSVKARAVSCDVPAVPLDVRLAADVFAPRYLWDVDEEDLGELRLSRGTVVTGYARSPQGAAAGTVVDLRPASLAWSPEDHQRLDAQKRSAKTNERGFFQFIDVAAGEYVAVAQRDGWSPAQQRVVVREGRAEEAVGEELVLGELGGIDVAIQPPADPQQRPWQVRLDRMVAGESQRVTQSAASITGAWQHSGLNHGGYSLSVLDADGKAMAREGLGVWGGRQFVAITIDQVLVRGTLTVADEPLEARLEFFDIDGRRIWMTADADGRFAGMLPAQGKWGVNVVREGRGRIELRDIQVRRSDATGYADIALQLPDGRVSGVVVNAAGEPVAARVRVWRNNRLEVSGLFKDGAFDFIGVATGNVELWADAREGESGLLPHTIRKDTDDSLKIVVKKRRVLSGAVVSPEGLQVAGAHVLWLHTYMIEEEFTGPRGQFKIELPAAETHVDVAVSAIGYPVKLVRLVPGAEDPQRVQLSRISGEIFIPMFTGKGAKYPYLGAVGLRPLPISLMGGRSLPRPEGLPVRVVRGGFLINAEPGAYHVCSSFDLEICEPLTLHAGARETIDTSNWKK